MTLYSDTTPRNINVSLYNAWFKKEYPELFTSNSEDEKNEESKGDENDIFNSFMD